MKQKCKVVISRKNEHCSRRTDRYNQYNSAFFFPIWSVLRTPTTSVQTFEDDNYAVKLFT